MRYGIPLLIVVFTAVLAVYTVQKEWGAAEAVVRGQAVSQMINLYLAAAGRLRIRDPPDQLWDRR